MDKVDKISAILLIAFVAYIGVCMFSYASKVDEQLGIVNK